MLRLDLHFPLVNEKFPNQIMPDSNTDNKKSPNAVSVYCPLGRAYYLHLGVLERILKKEGLDKKLRPGMCNVLLALLDEDGQRINTIASRIRVAKSTMTGTVDRLKASGLVKVKVDFNDRRAQRLSLTAKGKSLEPALRTALAQLESTLGETMSAAEKKEFSRLLEVVIDSMESKTDSV